MSSDSSQTDAKWYWQWGQLPTPPPKIPTSRKNSSKCHKKETKTTETTTEEQNIPTDPNNGKCLILSANIENFCLFLSI